MLNQTGLGPTETSEAGRVSGGSLGSNDFSKEWFPASIAVATNTFAGRRQGIAYENQLFDALNRHGIKLAAEPLIPTCAWLRHQRDRVDVALFQWPENTWSPQFQKLRMSVPWLFRLRAVSRALESMGACFRLCQLAWFLDAARAKGLRIGLTIHNIEPHEGSGLLDRIGYGMLCKKSDFFICHSESARRECDERYHTSGRTVVMMQGNYDGVYPPPRSRSEVLKDLGLESDLPVVCCLGGLRHYKGFDIACEAVATLGGSVQLIVAGNPIPEFDLGGLRRRIDAVPRAVLLPRRLTDAEFADFASASDAILLPYRRITTSALLMTAFTLGRGVIASDLPYIREVLDFQPEAGVLFKPIDARALARSIDDFLKVPSEIRNAAARKLASKFDWSDTVAPVVELFARWFPAVDGSDR